MRLKQKKTLINKNKDSAQNYAEEEFPEPHSGTGSALYYFDSASVNERCHGGQNEPKNAENTATINYDNLKPDELMRYYLQFVINNLDKENLYRKTDKEVQEYFGFYNESKALRIRKRAIEMGFLVPQLERKQYLSPQKAKISRYLSQNK
jgi:hypothetical protein